MNTTEDTIYELSETVDALVQRFTGEYGELYGFEGFLCSYEEGNEADMKEAQEALQVVSELVEKLNSVTKELGSNYEKYADICKKILSD